MTNTTKLDRHCVIDDGDQTIAGWAPGVKSRVRRCKAIASRRRCRPLITTTPGGAGPGRAGWADHNGSAGRREDERAAHDKYHLLSDRSWRHAGDDDTLTVPSTRCQMMYSTQQSSRRHYINRCVTATTSLFLVPLIASLPARPPDAAIPPVGHDAEHSDSSN